VVRHAARQPKLSVRQQSHPVTQHRSGEHTIADLAELLSVSRATVYRVLERAGRTGKAADQQP
jgi:transposase